jgi:hypothetical protein
MGTILQATLLQPEYFDTFMHILGVTKVLGGELFM